MVYDVNDYDEANTTFEFFLQASERCNLFVEEPKWIELPQRSNT